MVWDPWITTLFSSSAGSVGRSDVEGAMDNRRGKVDDLYGMV